jgi:hypothetical protein
VHKGEPGLSLCYYATGLQEGGPHDVYACFDKRDIVWALRVRFPNERNRYQLKTGYLNNLTYLDYSNAFKLD